MILVTNYRRKKIGDQNCQKGREFSNLFLGHLICFDSLDRKSTRLNSSHANISYAVFCLKKKKKKQNKNKK